MRPSQQLRCQTARRSSRPDSRRRGRVEPKVGGPAPASQPDQSAALRVGPADTVSRTMVTALSGSHRDPLRSRVFRGVRDRPGDHEIHRCRDLGQRFTIDVQVQPQSHCGVCGQIPKRHLEAGSFEDRRINPPRHFTQVGDPQLCRDRNERPDPSCNNFLSRISHEAPSTFRAVALRRLAWSNCQILWMGVLLAWKMRR